MAKPDTRKTGMTPDQDRAVRLLRMIGWKWGEMTVQKGVYRGYAELCGKRGPLLFEIYPDGVVRHPDTNPAKKTRAA